MFPKNIKLILAIALLGYGVYQITETYIGNGIFMFLLSIIVIVLYFKNEILILAFLSLRKQNYLKVTVAGTFGRPKGFILQAARYHCSLFTGSRCPSRKDKIIDVTDWLP